MFVLGSGKLTSEHFFISVTITVCAVCTAYKGVYSAIEKLMKCFYSSSQLYAATITGQAFLRHQIRCMVSILFLVGNRLESPEVSKSSPYNLKLPWVILLFPVQVINHMLDISRCPRKPQYGMASG